MSPVGIREKPEDEPTLDPMKRFEGRKGPGIPGWMFSKVGGFTWKKKVSPFAASRFFGKKFTLKILNNYVTKR